MYRSSDLDDPGRSGLLPLSLIPTLSSFKLASDTASSYEGGSSVGVNSVFDFRVSILNVISFLYEQKSKIKTVFFFLLNLIQYKNYAALVL